MSLKMLRSPDDIFWTCPRSELPPLLDGRVSLSQWQSTFDGVMAVYQKNSDGISSLTPWIFIPCCVCCIMRKMVAINSEVETMWGELVTREQKQYRSLGIQVTLARELISSGAGSHRHLENETVGLKFDIASGAAPGAAVSAGGGDMVSQLEKLNQLYQTGAITRLEYDQAKAKLLD